MRARVSRYRVTMCAARLAFRKVGDRSVRIALSGEVSLPLVSSLQACAQAAVAEGRRQFVVDLTAVASADEAVVEGLRRLSELIELSGATVVAVSAPDSPLAEALREAGLEPQITPTESRFRGLP